jgi:hypothetical protein
VFNNLDNTDSYNYTLATHRLKNAGASTTANRITFVVGLQEDSFAAVNNAVSTNSSASIARITSIGLNSTTTPATKGHVGQAALAGNQAQTTTGGLRQQAPLGLTILCPLEWSVASGTTAWQGDGGNAWATSLFTMEIRG